MKWFLVLFSLVVWSNLIAQNAIKMEQINGVFYVPCVVNGLPLKFIFDTGASEVSISMTEALFMIKNDYLSKDDIIGSDYYRIANGEIIEGTRIVIRELKVGEYTLKNITASIVHNLSAPLLLGQNILEQFGEYKVDYKNQLLILGAETNNLDNDNSNENPTDSCNCIYYEVKAGDSLWDISKKFKGVTVEDIKRDNGLTSASEFKVGMKLKIRKFPTQ